MFWNFQCALSKIKSPYWRLNGLIVAVWVRLVVLHRTVNVCPRVTRCDCAFSVDNRPPLTMLHHPKLLCNMGRYAGECHCIESYNNAPISKSNFRKVLTSLLRGNPHHLRTKSNTLDRENFLIHVTCNRKWVPRMGSQIANCFHILVWRMLLLFKTLTCR